MIAQWKPSLRVHYQWLGEWHAGIFDISSHCLLAETYDPICQLEFQIQSTPSLTIHSWFIYWFGMIGSWNSFYLHNDHKYV